ncbi:MAG: hypothetical protein CR988_03800 [Treponema sp.]|nr:MAG: hypothetical protein CR988_03800 [Treponema sp.]
MLNLKNAKNIIIFFFLFISFFPCQAEEKTEWVISASKFNTVDIPELYKTYETIVPELFLYNLNSHAKRVIPLSEQKARALFKLGKTKLKLIKERNSLILERDKIFLSFTNEKNKKSQIKKINEKIKQKEEAIFFAHTNMKIEELKFSFADESKPIVPWNNGNTLFEKPKTSGLTESLLQQNIDAVITGTIKDISGYAYVSVKLETGLPNMQPLEFAEAGRYEDISEIVKFLSSQIYTKIQNIPEVMLHFDITPKTASVFVNEIEINDFSKPVKVHNGKINIYASAEGYKSSIKEVNLKNHNAYKLRINLKKDELFNISFDIKNMKPEVYFKTKYYGVVPIELEIPNTKNMLEFISNDVRTFIIFDNNKFTKQEELIYATAKLHKTSISEKIEKRRKNMYWSLGALYLSLPATLILNGITNDKIIAYQSGNLPATQKNINTIRNLRIASNVMIGVSSSLAVNYFINVILYLVAADKTLPVEAQTLPIPMQKNKISKKRR